jgi:hypothetical protein
VLCGRARQTGFDLSSKNRADRSAEVFLVFAGCCGVYYCSKTYRFALANCCVVRPDCGWQASGHILHDDVRKYVPIISQAISSFCGCPGNLLSVTSLTVTDWLPAAKSHGIELTFQNARSISMLFRVDVNLYLVARHRAVVVF